MGNDCARIRLEYQAGKSNFNADALSRNPVSSENVPAVSSLAVLALDAVADLN